MGIELVFTGLRLASYPLEIGKREENLACFRTEFLCRSPRQILPDTFP